MKPKRTITEETAKLVRRAYFYEGADAKQLLARFKISKTSLVRIIGGFPGPNAWKPEEHWV